MTVEVVAWTAGLSAPATRVQVAEAEIELRLAISAVDESLMVTASYVDTPLSLLADSVNTLSRADLDARQITTLGDALRLVPGFTVARNGGPGTVTSVFPRGGESDYTMVLVDGVRMNTFGGGMDLSQVPIAGAERVEVVRGPQSALYGSDAIGGVVQVLTSRAGDPMVDALVEGGGRDARRVAGSARGSLGDVYGTLSGQYMEDEGYTGVAPADGSTVSNDDSRVSDVAVGLGWRRASGTDLFGTFQYLDSDRGSPGPYGSNPAGNFGGVDRTARSLTWRRSGAARLIQPLGGAASRVRLRAEADVADFDLEYRDEFGSVGETTRGHGRLQADAAFADGLSASAGGEWVGESGRSTYILSNTGEVPVDRDVLGGLRRGPLAANGAPLVHRRRPRLADHAGGAAWRPQRLPAAAGLRRRDHRRREPQGHRGLDRRPRRRRVGRLDAAARGGWHRHPPARCLRDRVHRQRRARSPSAARASRPASPRRCSTAWSRSMPPGSTTPTTT